MLLANHKTLIEKNFTLPIGLFSCWWCGIILLDSLPADLFNLINTGNSGNIKRIGNILISAIFPAYHPAGSHTQCNVSLPFIPGNFNIARELFPVNRPNGALAIKDQPCRGSYEITPSPKKGINAESEYQ